MATLWNSVSAVLVILLMTGVGYFSGRMGWIKPEHKSFINSIFVHVSLPCMCIQSILTRLTREMLGGMAVMMGASFATIVLAFALALALSRLLKLPRRRAGVFVIMGGLSNTISIGLPMCLGLFGEDSTPFVMIYYLINATVLHSFGAAILQWSGGGEARFSLRDLGAVFKKPPFVAITLAVLMLLLGVSLPTPIMRAMGYLGDLSSPLMLLYTGFILYEIGLANLKLERGIPAMLLLRFFIVPGICLAAAAVMGVTGFMRGVLVAESAMPAPSQVVNLAGAVGADEEYAAQGVVISTLCCFITMPLLMLLLG